MAQAQAQAHAMLQPASITGLVLAGGRGSRMGGIDKGLQTLAGVPLSQHVLERLRPQVGPLMVNANRHLAQYAAFGVPVLTDALPDHPGPLAGFLAGLAACTTPWLVTVPCDAPRFPTDLVARLARGLIEAQAEVAMAVSNGPEGAQSQPVFCLMRADLGPSLNSYVAGGQRQVERWVHQQRHALVCFDEPLAFANANTMDELAALQPRA